MKVFLNEQIICSDSPLIYINDRGFTLGDGLFETIKATPSHIHHFTDHYNRLSHSASYLGIPLDYCHNKLLETSQNLIQANNLENETASIRITLTRGRSTRGIAIPKSCHSTLLITATPYHPQDNFYPRAHITSIRRNEYSALAQHKTTQYLESILARKIANERGYDEGIMLNTKGALSETSIANLFLVIDNKVYTSRIDDGALPGILRKKIFDCCHQLGIPSFEQELMPPIIKDATEAFQTNSLIEVQSLSSIDNTILNTGDLSIITNMIITQYQKNIKNYS